MSEPEDNEAPVGDPEPDDDDAPASEPPRAASSATSREADEHHDDGYGHGHDDEDIDHDDDDDEPDEHEGRGRRRRPDSLFRETLRRAVEKGVETGIGTFTRADSAFRGVVDEVKLPKEVAQVLFAQVDETKNALVGGVAREVRDFLEATDIANEFYRALTSLSFEIKTEVRFIPNDSGGVRPDVKAKVSPKRDKRRGRRKRGAPESDDDKE